MSGGLTDADLTALEDRYGNEMPAAAQDPQVVRLVAEHRALRARVVGGTEGPDQGGPAAPVLWQALDSRGAVIYTTPVAEAAEVTAQRIGGTTRGLHVGAPGAVAAAPHTRAQRIERLHEASWPAHRGDPLMAHQPPSDPTRIRPDLVLDRNEYGTPIAVKHCTACGNRFTVCPPDWEDRFGSECLGDGCPSYDPRRDVDLLMSVGVQVARGPRTPGSDR